MNRTCTSTKVPDSCASVNKKKRPSLDSGRTRLVGGMGDEDPFLNAFVIGGEYKKKSVMSQIQSEAAYSPGRRYLKPHWIVFD